MLYDIWLDYERHWGTWTRDVKVTEGRMWLMGGGTSEVSTKEPITG